MRMKVWVALGRVKEGYRIGNIEADAAADLGGKRVHYAITAVRKLVNRVCARWCPVVQELHRFFIAIAEAALNDGGGGWYFVASVVWFAAASPKKEKGWTSGS